MTQEELLAYIQDPETIKKAVEGSMDKRIKRLTEVERLERSIK